MDYQTLTDEDRLAIARDALRAAESDHFRISLDPASGGGEPRLKQLEERVLRLREEVALLETK